MFMVNKQMMMNISLSEIKNMSPEEMYLLVEQMAEMGQELEAKKGNKNGI